MLLERELLDPTIEVSRVVSGSIEPWALGQCASIHAGAFPVVVGSVPFDVFELSFEDKDLLFEICEEMWFLLHFGGHGVVGLF